MGKKSRARVAAAGTRKDPERRVVKGGKAKRADKEKKVGAHAHPEWAPHLNSASEDLTAKLFTLVEVILGVVPLVVIGLFLASKDATSVDKLTEVFSQDPSMVVTFISACLQPFVAYMLYMVYRKYCEGDAGFVAGNLIGLLCSEILLLNIPGVIGMGILLWRVWRNVAPHFESWLFERRAMGVLVDIAGSLVILVLAFMCATAARGLAGLTARACQRVLAHRLVCAPPLMGAARFAWGPCLHTFRQAFGQLLVSWRASGRAKDHPIKKLKESAGRGVVEVFDSFCQQETLRLLLRIALPWPWRCGMLGASVECSD